MLLVPLLIIFFSMNVVGEVANETNSTVEYDPAILDAFNNQSWVNVIVRLVDNSNITITSTKEEKTELIRQRDGWFEPKIDEVLSTLSEDEFVSLRKLSNGFGGSITIEGFDKLINNPAVSEIQLDIGGSIALDENISVYTVEHTVDYDPEILEAFYNQTQVSIIVRLKDNSNITVIGSKDERRALSRQRDEWFKPVREEVLATLSETEFELSSRLFNGFSGTITREGFDKLLNNTAVRKIIWDNTPLPEATTNENVSVAENVTEENITNETQIKEEPTEKEPEKQNIFQKIINWVINLFG